MALSPQIGEMCGSFTAEAMDQLRDAVAEAASAFSVALDRVLGTSELLRDNYGKTYHSTQAILEASNHLEHFHVYDKKENTHVSTALDWHTDAGLFLGFVPAWDCISTDRDASFWFRDQQGQASLAEFAPDSVVIMLGLGAQNWLQTNVPLKAAVHAVHMRAGQQRAWYGMSKYCCFQIQGQMLNVQVYVLITISFLLQCIWYPRVPLFKPFRKYAPLVT
jgi:hypothetical protein